MSNHVHVATAAGEVDALRALLDAGAAVNQADEHGKTPLMLASQFGYGKCVRALLEAGAAVQDANEHGGTALMLASLNGHAACVRLLLEAAAAVDQTDDYGQTALMLACHEGHAECARTLLEAGAKVNHDNEHGGTALMLASYGGHADCVRILLGAGAAVDHAGARGMTALMLASLEGNVNCVRALLSAGADVLCANPEKLSALHYGRAHLSVVQLLCAHGAQRADLFEKDPELAGLPEDCRAWLLETKGWTSQLHHLELLPAARVRALIVGGADPHASDGLSAESPTPLTLARALLSRSGFHESAQLVVDAAAPWSRNNHALFPRAARLRAKELLLLGYVLAFEARFASEPVAVLDVWQQHVMAFAVSRS